MSYRISYTINGERFERVDNKLANILGYCQAMAELGHKVENVTFKKISVA